jgi:hypothetical protein
MGVGTAAGSLCVGRTDSVPAFIFKKRFKLYVRLNVGIHYIAVCIYQKIIPLLNLHLHLH